MADDGWQMAVLFPTTSWSVIPNVVRDLRNRRRFAVSNWQFAGESESPKVRKSGFGDCWWAALWLALAGPCTAADGRGMRRGAA